jgi:cytochrome c peroxidase
VSLGDDGHSLGDRNAPSLTYAALTPLLRRDADGVYAGGLFHDGRARDLADQAGQPILNPLEMGMPDAAAVVARVNENPAYTSTLRELGAADSMAAFETVRAALAAFEQTALFEPYDSRYDRSLRGEATLTAQEELGRMLFFSSLANCSSCHVLDQAAARAREPFTSFRYLNIGVPANAAVRAVNGHTRTDRGLRDNPAVADDATAGKFRVPTLRNVAVTAPYMHNGVFRELGTVLFFYNQYLALNERNATNPETGRRWEPPEVPATVDRERLRAGQPLDDARIAALIAFLRTLTDQRYEALLPQSDLLP